MSNVDSPQTDSEATRNARLESLKNIFGEPEPVTEEGITDVLSFPHPIEGKVYVTASLTGPGSAQVASSTGNYELVMCVKEDFPTGMHLLSNLAQHTCQAPLAHGDTMDFHEGSDYPALYAILFLNYPAHTALEFLGQSHGLLLCIGITEAELAYKHAHGTEALVELLQSKNVFPYTIPERESVCEGTAPTAEATEPQLSHYLSAEDRETVKAGVIQWVQSKEFDAYFTKIHESVGKTILRMVLYALSIIGLFKLPTLIRNAKIYPLASQPLRKKYEELAANCQLVVAIVYSANAKWEDKTTVPALLVGSNQGSEEADHFVETMFLQLDALDEVDPENPNNQVVKEMLHDDAYHAFRVRSPNLTSPEGHSLYLFDTMLTKSAINGGDLAANPFIFCLANPELKPAILPIPIDVVKKALTPPPPPEPVAEEAAPAESTEPVAEVEASAPTEESSESHSVAIETASTETSSDSAKS